MQKDDRFSAEIEHKLPNLMLGGFNQPELNPRQHSQKA